MSEDTPTPADPPESGEDSGPDLEHRTTRPSLDVLHRDQTILLYEGDRQRTPPISPVTEPFDSRRAVINWWQAAACRTLGHVMDYWDPIEILRDPALTDALLDRSADPAVDAYLRNRVLEEWLLPACRQAYRSMRDRAQERTANQDGGSWREVDPEESAHIAMRPAFSRLDAEQAALLSDLWGGFEDRGAVHRWLHDCAPATYGELGEQWAREMLHDPVILDALLCELDRERSRAWRERLAVVVLLPAFARAVRVVDAGETDEKDTDPEWRQG